MKRMTLILSILILTGNMGWAEENYTGRYTKKNGELSCQMLPGNKIKFLINTTVGMQTCDIGRHFNTTAVLADKSHAVFKGDANCVLELSFEKNKVTVKTKNCDAAYCGITAAGTMDGVFMKKSGTPEFYGSE